MMPILLFSSWTSINFPENLHYKDSSWYKKRRVWIKHVKEIQSIRGQHAPINRTLNSQDSAKKLESRAHPPSRHHLHTFIDTIQEDFLKFDVSSLTIKTRRNLTRKEKLALKQLSKNKEIVIRAADKGGGVVIQYFFTYHREAPNILSDEEFYEKVLEDPFPGLERRFKELLKGAMDSHITTKSTRAWRSPLGDPLYWEWTVSKVTSHSTLIYFYRFTWKACKVTLGIQMT